MDAANGGAPRGGRGGGCHGWAGWVGVAGDGNNCVLRASLRAIHGALRPRNAHPPGLIQSTRVPAALKKIKSKSKSKSTIIGATHRAAKPRSASAFAFAFAFYFLQRGWARPQRVRGSGGWDVRGRVAPWMARREARRTQPSPSPACSTRPTPPPHITQPSREGPRRSPATQPHRAAKPRSAFAFAFAFAFYFLQRGWHARGLYEVGWVGVAGA